MSVRTRQPIPVVGYSVRPGAIKLPPVAERTANVLAAQHTESAFSLGHGDGYADAVNGNPRDPAQRFQSWHKRRPVSDFADYESAYVASWEQVRKGMVK